MSYGAGCPVSANQPVQGRQGTARFFCRSAFCRLGERQVANQSVRIDGISKNIRESLYLLQSDSPSERSVAHDLIRLIRVSQLEIKFATKVMDEISERFGEDALCLYGAMGLVNRKRR